MTAATTDELDVLAIWKAARRDPRLNEPCRRILAHLARHQKMLGAKRFAVLLSMPVDVAQASIDLLAACGYVPPPVQEPAKHLSGAAR